MLGLISSVDSKSMWTAYYLCRMVPSGRNLMKKILSEDELIWSANVSWLLFVESGSKVKSADGAVVFVSKCIVVTDD